MSEDARRELGYVPAPPAPPSAPKLPELTSEQFGTLRRVQHGSLLDRKVWTLLSLDEIARMRLVARSTEGDERWIVTPLGVEVLERAKGTKR